MPILPMSIFERLALGHLENIWERMSFLFCLLSRRT
jgi:hypothetical protein